MYDVWKYMRTYDFECEEPRLTYDMRKYKLLKKQMVELEQFIKAIETLHDFSKESGIPLYFTAETLHDFCRQSNIPSHINNPSLLDIAISKNTIYLGDEGIIIATCFECLLCSRTLRLLFGYKCSHEYCYNKIHDKAVKLYSKYMDWKKAMEPILDKIRKYDLAR